MKEKEGRSGGRRRRRRGKSSLLPLCIEKKEKENISLSPCLSGIIGGGKRYFWKKVMTGGHYESYALSDNMVTAHQAWMSHANYGAQAAYSGRKNDGGSLLPNLWRRMENVGRRKAAGKITAMSHREKSVPQEGRKEGMCIMPPSSPYLPPASGSLSTTTSWEEGRRRRKENSYGRNCWIGCAYEGRRKRSSCSANLTSLMAGILKEGRKENLLLVVTF